MVFVKQLLKKLFLKKSHGSATVLNAGIIIATFVIFGGVLAFGMFSMANAKLTTALENASIAGAMYYKVTGWEPCEVVRSTLEANDSQMISCKVLEDKNVEVQASRIAFGPDGPITTIRKYARAGQTLICDIF
ncbi:MAG: flp pilus-assembly TadE/G-like family protein [Bifidobacteriaceae bacterium]|jgi:secretion/DNA translocation related TadE-like protein|nr:flp pilus-assembly TadE/G-like family protein [Bifidobacteriaceae bacterium]